MSDYRATGPSDLSSRQNFVRDVMPNASCFHYRPVRSGSRTTVGYVTIPDILKACEEPRSGQFLECVRRSTVVENADTDQGEPSGGCLLCQFSSADFHRFTQIGCADKKINLRESADLTNATVCRCQMTQLEVGRCQITLTKPPPKLNTTASCTAVALSAGNMCASARFSQRRPLLVGLANGAVVYCESTRHAD